MKEKIEEILGGLKEGIKDHFGEKTLVSDGLLDSLDIMNLIMKLEDAFEIEIDPEDVLSENFESIDSIATLVEKCQD